MSNLAIIGIRSGSQGVKDKNIRLFRGKPLVHWAIQVAKKSKKIDRVIVSTDSEKYRDIVLESVEYENMEDEMLQWTFYGTGKTNANRGSKVNGSVNNTSLSESLNKALKNQKKKFKNRVLYSYIIALNGNKQ